jgi:hypothetical protein
MSLNDALTDARVAGAKLADKPVRISDGKGLYLEVLPPGGKLWRMKYRFGGKQKTLALGVFPDVSLNSECDQRCGVC